MPGVLDMRNGRIERTRPRAIPEAERPGWIESFQIQSRLSIDEWTDAQRHRRWTEDEALADALGEMGYRRQDLIHGQQSTRVLGIPISVHSERLDGQKLWQAVEAERRKNPKAFADIPARTFDEYQRWALGQRGRREEDMQRLATASGATQITTGLTAGSLADMADSSLGPFQFMIGGGGKSVLSAALREATVATVEEGLKQPERIRNRKKLGEETSLGDIALELGASAVFAGVLGGTGYAVASNWDTIKAAPKDAQERAWAAILNRTPGLREKVGSAIEWDALDPHLADIVEATVPIEARSADLRGALAASRAQGQLARANPFADDAAGRSAHRDGMAVAMQRIMADMEGRPPPVAPPATRARLAQDTGLATRTVPGDARSVVKNRIGVVESGNSATARNPRSTATGTFQFIESTWLRTYKNRYGQNGLTNAQILAKRTDPRLQNILMDDLMDTNIRALEADGISPTAGNIYLAHFAGSGGARALHRALDLPVEQILGAGAVRANPFLRGMRGRDVIAWAERKMGGSGGGAVSARGSAPTAPSRVDELQQGIDALEAERAALARAAGEEPDDPLEAALDDALPAPLPESALDIPQVRREEFAPEETVPESVQDLLPILRTIRNTQGAKLNDVGRLARELGASEDDVRAALTRMALLGEVQIVAPRSTRGRVRGSGGRWRYRNDAEMIANAGGVWPGKFKRREDGRVRTGGTLLEWISARGGIRERFGDQATQGVDNLRAMDIDQWHRQGAFRRKIIRTDGTGETLEELFDAAIDQGFFPEFAGQRAATANVSYAELPDIKTFIEAIRRELAGDPVRSVEGRALQTALARADAEEEAAFLSNRAGAGDDMEAALEVIRDDFRTLWTSYGLDLDDLPEDIIVIAAERWAAGEGLSPEHVIATMAQEDAAAVLRLQVDEAMDRAYGPDALFNPRFDDERFARYEEAYRNAGIEPDGDFVDGGNSAGFGEQPTAARAGDPGGEAAARGGDDPAIETGPIEPEAHRAFDDPNGPGAAEQAESVLHDMRAGVERGTRDGLDPNATRTADTTEPVAPTDVTGQMDFAAPTQEQRRIALERQAEGRQRSDVAQKPPGSDGGLFDVRAEDIAFRIDEEGDPVTARQLLDDLDEDVEMLKNMKDCLK